MSIKKLIVATVVWMALIFVGGGLGFWYIFEHPLPGVSADIRAGKLGQGFATVASLGLGAIWLPFAYKLGEKRRAERAKQQSAKTKRPKRPTK
jgi:hypothetical protein